MFCQQGGAQEAGREHDQGSCLKLAKGIFHTIEHPAQCISWGSCPGGADGCSGTGWVSASGEQLCCVSLVFLGFYFSFSSGCLPFHYIIIIIIIITTIIVIIVPVVIQLLNCSYLNTWVLPTLFPVLLPIPLWGYGE